MDFRKKFDQIVTKNKSLLCVGLDPEVEKLPAEFSSRVDQIFNFNRSIIRQTADLVCAYKPNIAFYESYGLESLNGLKKTILYLQNEYPHIPIILDAKRADIANTAQMYAKSVFEYWGADATTVYPHLGLDSLEPFLKYKDKLTIVIIKTSNPDAKIFQDLNVGGQSYWLKVAKEIKKWKFKNLGLFVGATYTEDLKKVRAIFPDKIILSAGLGVQGADIKRSVKSGVDKNGSGIIFNASRSIIYSRNPRKDAQKLRDDINKYRSV